MNRLTYLESYHTISQTLIDLISVANDMEEIKSYLDHYQPELNRIWRARVIDHCIST